MIPIYKACAYGASIKVVILGATELDGDGEMYVVMECRGRDNRPTSIQFVPKADFERNWDVSHAGVALCPCAVSQMVFRAWNNDETQSFMSLGDRRSRAWDVIAPLI